MKRIVDEIVANYDSVEYEEINSFLSGKDLSAGFWLIEEIGHIPKFELHQFDSVEDMKDRILGEAGLLNAFTTCSIPIDNGQVLSYDLIYKEGGKTIIFSKDQQLASDAPFKDDSGDWKIRWKRK